jgi:hypothetical protein
VDNDVRGARSNFDSCVEYCQRATEQEAYQPEAGELLSRCKQKLGPLMLADHADVLEEVLTEFENARAPAMIVSAGLSANHALEKASKDLPDEDYKKYAQRYNATFDQREELIKKFTEFEARREVAANLVNQKAVQSDIDFYEKEMAETTDPATDSEFKEKLDNRKQALELLKREFNEWADEAGIYEDVEVESAAD